MDDSRRNKPGYRRREEEQARSAAESNAMADAAQRAVLGNMMAAADVERWAGVDPSQRIHIVRPFGPSSHHRLDASDIARFLAIKGRTLGYLGCVVKELDDEKVYEFEGPPSWVAGREDAIKLIEALALAYPHVPFRAEAIDYVVDQVQWLRAERESGTV